MTVPLLCWTLNLQNSKWLSSYSTLFFISIMLAKRLPDRRIITAPPQVERQAAPGLCEGGLLAPRRVWLSDHRRLGPPGAASHGGGGGRGSDQRPLEAGRGPTNHDVCWLLKYRHFEKKRVLLRFLHLFWCIGRVRFQSFAYWFGMAPYHCLKLWGLGLKVFKYCSFCNFYQLFDCIIWLGTWIQSVILKYIQN